MTPSLSNRNVISIDYRGYGDSTGTPSEDGLLIDALTAWDYVHRHAAASEGEGSGV
jgi:abhydrolase domain-containing protein 12